MPPTAKFDDFVKISNFFYRTIGIQPYNSARLALQRSSTLSDTIFYIGMINTNVMVIGLVVYIYLAFINGNNFVEAVMTMVYIGFVAVGEFKMMSVWWKKDELMQFMRTMNVIFPKTEEQQTEYKLHGYLYQCRIITTSFSLLYMALIWTYNLFAMMQYLIYERWLQVRVVGQTLPYYCYLPWDWHDHWSFYVIYALQSCAGYMTAAGAIACDLLLCAVATQIVMHYDYVTRTIESYVVQTAGVNDAKVAHQKNVEFLSEIITYHDRILSLSADMNEVFGVPLLFSFIVSSFIICFVGFQMSIGVDVDAMFKLILYLISSTAQVYMICYYGQWLSDASSNISKAVYSQNWVDADVRYKKMLVLVAARAQKPALLKATSYFRVSRGTMTDIMQMSYKFFALLRTMYSN